MPGSEQFNLTGNAAEFYNKIPARYLLGPWAPELVEAAEIQPDERVLDLACGTGVVTRAAAAKMGPTGRITGLDLNEGMLAVAKTLGNPGTGKMEWVQASALDTELPDASFDVVLCQQGFQFFPDQTKALGETYRVLRVGGRVWFSVWAEAGPYNDAVAGGIRKHIDDATATRYLASRDVPSPSSLRSMFTEAGFVQVKVTRSEMENRLPNIAEFVVSHLQGTPVADAFGALAPEAQVALGIDAAEGLAPYADGYDAVVPDFINLVSATK